MSPLSHLVPGKKYLVTTNDWFIGSDGRQYRGVYGELKAVVDAETTLGIRTNTRSTNWYAVIGNVTVAGCQIHYVIQTETKPPRLVDDFSYEQGETRYFTRPSTIFIADDC